MFTFSKNQLLVLLISSIVFFISILLISSLIFMISFFLLTLGFVCSFSNLFRWWVKLSIWDFSSFLRKAYITMNVHLRTAFPASHRFCMVVFSKHSFYISWENKNCVLPFIVIFVLFWWCRTKPIMPLMYAYTFQRQWYIWKVP